MTLLYPIVFETEESGAVSAYVPGLPVYAAADSHAKAERAIHVVLTNYLTRTGQSADRTGSRRTGLGQGRREYSWRCRSAARIVRREGACPRANGRLGGRPQRTTTRRTTRSKASRKASPGSGGD